MRILYTKHIVRADSAERARRHEQAVKERAAKERELREKTDAERRAWALKLIDEVIGDLEEKRLCE